MPCRILTKEATPESKQQTSDREQSKRQIILYTRALQWYIILFAPGQTNITPVYIGTAFSFLSNAFRVKNQFKENPKASKTTKEATKENKNDVAHKMHSTCKLVTCLCMPTQATLSNREVNIALLYRRYFEKEASYLSEILPVQCFLTTWNSMSIRGNFVYISLTFLNDRQQPASD